MLVESNNLTICFFAVLDRKAKLSRTDSQDSGMIDDASDVTSGNLSVEVTNEEHATTTVCLNPSQMLKLMLSIIVKSAKYKGPEIPL